MRVEHERPFGKPSSRFLVIPVMCDQASFLFSFQMDPRSQSAGMTDESVMPDVLYQAFCWVPVIPDIRDRESILLTKT
ncbi:MAG: hypothetical protein KIT39_01450 [Nitrospirales bacterium]|nr:hypothetical protein [Nitrospirales bacterium]